MQDQWLSIAEYARHYNISDMTVRRRIKTGKIHAVLKDGKYFIPIDVDDTPWTDQSPKHQFESLSTRPHQSMNGRSQSHGSGSGQTHHYPESRFQRQGNFEATSQSPAYRSNDRPSFDSGTQRDFQSQNTMSGRHSPDMRPRSAHVPRPREPYKPSNNSVRQDHPALIRSCEAMLKKLEDAEACLRELAESKEKLLKEKIKTLEEEVTSRDLKLSQLSQKVEDMQTLIKMIGFGDSQSNQKSPESP